jgi:AcrR family transcriptional regulator
MANRNGLNGRKGTQKGDDRKLAILDAAIALFAQRGYRGAPLSSVAETAGLTLPGLLHHFPSKEDLLIAVLDERDRRDEIEMAAAYEHGAGAFEALTSLVAHNAESRDMVKLFTVLVGEAAVSDVHPAHQHVADRYRHVTDITVSCLEGPMVNGDVSQATDRELVARLLIAVMDGLQIQWLLDPSFDMRRTFEAFAGLIETAAAEGLVSGPD